MILRFMIMSPSKMGSLTDNDAIFRLPPPKAQSKDPIHQQPHPPPPPPPTPPPQSQSSEGPVPSEVAAQPQPVLRLLQLQRLFSPAIFGTTGTMRFCGERAGKRDPSAAAFSSPAGKTNVKHVQLRTFQPTRAKATASLEQMEGNRVVFFVGLGLGLVEDGNRERNMEYIFGAWAKFWPPSKVIENVAYFGLQHIRAPC